MTGRGWGTCLYLFEDNHLIYLMKLKSMNKVLIVDASESDRRLMSGLLVKRGYELIVVETISVHKPLNKGCPPWPTPTFHPLLQATHRANTQCLSKDRVN